jgi:two-component system, OmpR family, response regulator
MPYQLLARELNQSNMQQGNRENGQTKILIVDDELDICFLFYQILRKRNLKMSCANNLAEAKASVQTETPAVIFLDNCLPDGQGMDLIPYLKLHYPSTQVVMVTANDSAADKSRAFQRGADDFLEKPLSLARINGALDRLKVPGQAV